GLYAFKDSFYLDGRRFKIFSGSFHYFRTHPLLWGDRLLRMKAAGLNTVMTYVPWNFHEPRKGQFTLGGLYDLVSFMEQVQKVGLYLIVRPGPYICAEWEFGGFPSWLLRDPKMNLRTSSYTPYLNEVKQYLSQLFAVLTKFTYKHGGPIIAFQVENEFGSKGVHDPEYLQFLVTQYSSWNLNELLFTSDGKKYLSNGTLPDVLATINLNDHAKEDLEELKEFQPERPLMVTEFWAGWFDHWGEEHHHYGTTELERELEAILSLNASVNFYMFIGGTNFGFWNGANYLSYNKDKEASLLGPTVTSYDYDAAVSEWGHVKPKYNVIRNLLKKYSLTPLDLPDVPPTPMKKAYGVVVMQEYMSLDDLITLVPSHQQFETPHMMEHLSGEGQGYGFLLYRSHFVKTSMLIISGQLLDRAHVIINGQLKGIFSYWDELITSFNIPFAEGFLTANDSTVDILVENMGRVNYESLADQLPLLNNQRKGLDGAVRYPRGQQILQWTHVPLEFDDILCENLHSSSRWRPAQTTGLPSGPFVLRGTLHVDSLDPKDTFLKIEQWGRGIVLINGFNLGRYWNVGPQKSLYVPSPILKHGQNEVIIFE
ncbi:hypothetical protein CAPTEDRAFT_23316, partial [Capitella teleta]